MPEQPTTPVPSTQRRYRALAASIADPAKLLDRLPEGVVVTDQHGRIAYVNQAFAALLEFADDELLDQEFESLAIDEDMLKLAGFDCTLGAGAEDVQALLKTKCGNPRALSLSSAQSSGAECPLIVICARPAGVMQEELADAARWAASERQKSDELTRARDALVEKNEQLERIQQDLKHAFSSLTQHIEAQEKLEAELRLAQKLEAIGQLAAGVAHEINSPMQYIGDNIGFLKTAYEQLSEVAKVIHDVCATEPTLLRKIQQAEEQAQVDFLVEQIPEALDQASDGVARVSKIVQAMKAFSHQDEDDMAPEDIAGLITETLVVARSEYKNIAEVETHYADLPAVYCYGGQLRQVILNLVVNAAHALVDVEARDRVIHIETTREEDDLVISVADNGTGIPPEIQSRVFDPFFTTKPVGKGTGQGLSLARRIVVEGHGGTLTFQTEPDRGTTFYIRIPMRFTSKRC